MQHPPPTTSTPDPQPLAAARLAWLLPSAIGVATAVVFAQSLTNDFVGYDDPNYITENVHVLGGLTWAGVKWAFTATVMGHWHPLTWLSIMLDVQLFGLRPWGHHLTSVLLHSCSAAAVAWLLLAWTKRPGASAVAAALFAMHPLRVESVAWAAERKDVLCTLLTLLSLCAWTLYARRRSKRAYATALILFALALMAKAMAVTLPALLLLLDFWPLERWRTTRRRTLALEKVPFVALAFVAALIAPYAVRSVGALASLERLPLSERLLNAALSYGLYLSKELWPAKLAIFYPQPKGFHGEVWASIVAIVAITAVAIRLRRSAPALLVGWLWFLGVLFPVSGVLQSGLQAYADRYTYLPSLGLSIALVFGAATVVPLPRQPTAAAALLSCVLLVAVTNIQLGYWSDSERLFLHATEVASPNPPAEIALGVIREEQGRLDEAEAHERAALAEWPLDPVAQGNLARILLKAGRATEALPYIQAAYADNPNIPLTITVYANTLKAVGQRREGEQVLRTASVRLPQDSEAPLLLGAWYAEDGQFEPALQLFTEAVRRTPAMPAAHLNRGLALGRLNRYAEAEAELREALRLYPEYQSAQTALHALEARARNP
ncbi:MAG: tetratricopeptide repeat protein [Myxococcaceae bacterium]